MQLTIGHNSHWPDLFQSISCSSNCGVFELQILCIFLGIVRIVRKLQRRSYVAAQLNIGRNSHWPDLFQNISCIIFCGFFKVENLVQFYRNRADCGQFTENVLSCEVRAAQHKIGRNSHSNLFQPWRMHDIGSQRAPCFRLRFDGNSWTCSAGTRKSFLYLLCLLCTILKSETSQEMDRALRNLHYATFPPGG